MQEVQYTQMILDGDYYVALNAVDAQDTNEADIFHFASQTACENALRMCDVMSGDAANMQLLTGKFDDGFALVFKEIGAASRAFVFGFTSEQDLDAARDLAIRFWELEHYDAFAESDGEDTAENLIG